MKSAVTHLNKQALRWLAANRPEDLRELMEGESRYTLPHSIGISKASREESRAWVMAIYHIRYAAQFGLAQQRVIKGTYVHSSYSVEFEHWLELGAPGISAEELANYLNEVPIQNDDQSSDQTKA
jgi:hypothetical protein